MLSPNIIKALIAAGLFVSGLVIGSAVNGWRWEVKLKDCEETHAQAVITSQKAINAAQTRTAETSSILADFFGETDNETSKLLADLRVRNAALAADINRMRNSNSARSCPVPKPSPAPDNSAATQPAAGVSTVVSGVSAENLAVTYAAEADALRIEGAACARAYDEARRQIAELRR